MLRKISKRIAKESYAEFLKENKHNIYELVMLEGLVISSLKKPFIELVPHYERFFTKADSWAHIDATIQKNKTLNKDEALSVVKKWLQSPQEYTVRAGLVLLLTNYVEEKYLQDIFLLSQAITHKAYYVHMANAWLISECMAQYPLLTKEFFTYNTLDAKTHNKAIQKSKESFRVSQEDKEFLKTLQK